MNVLLVEDEEHKTTDLKIRLIKGGVLEEQLFIVKSVREAVILVEERDFDLVVLDMALPTFSQRADKPGEKGGGGGENQAVGGVEILRSLHAAGKRVKIIIVTQYPEITINSEKIRLANAPKMISERYDQKLIGAVLYSFNTRKWEDIFDKFLEVARADSNI